VRIAPSDDIQAPALASFAYQDLNARVALVVDDAADGREIADGFQQAYEKLGGTVIRRALNPGADPPPSWPRLPEHPTGSAWSSSAASPVPARWAFDGR